MNRRSWLAATALVCLLGSCTPTVDHRTRFEQWAEQPQQTGLAEYRRYLEQQQVADVVPLPELLRSSRRWRECAAAEFSLPPRNTWSNLVPVLRALREMQAAGIATGAQVRSTYRDEALNRCSGGSPRSRHRLGAAVDLDLADADQTQRLCAYWRQHGPAQRLGLGFYTPTRIHLDTAGFRTWGSDHTWRSSLCRAP